MLLEDDYSGYGLVQICAGIIAHYWARWDGSLSTGPL